MKSVYLKNLVCAVAFLFMTIPVVQADGKHNVKIKVYNSFNQKIKVDVFNGNDKMNCNGGVPHKSYTIGYHGTETVKCHGQGKKRCFVRYKKEFGTRSVCEKASNGSRISASF